MPTSLSGSSSCGNANVALADEYEAEHQRRMLKARADLNRRMAEAREHRAHAPRYERQLNMPPTQAPIRMSAVSRGAPEQMCSAQWQQLQEIRAHDRERRARKREHERAVEVELQTMTASPVAAGTGAVAA